MNKDKIEKPIKLDAFDVDMNKNIKGKSFIFSPSGKGRFSAKFQTMTTQKEMDLLIDFMNKNKIKYIFLPLDFSLSEEMQKIKAQQPIMAEPGKGKTN